MRHLLIGGKIVTETAVIDHGYLIMNEETILAIGSGEAPSESEVDEVTYLDSEDIIFPGFIDIHIHGGAGYDMMDATQEALATIAATLPREGTTSFLATTMTDTEAHIEMALANAAEFNKRAYQGAELLGVHLEGPFISPEYAGAQPLPCIVPPSIQTFRKWQALAEGLIRVVTLAPEQQGGQALIQYLHENGVIASVGHSHAALQDVEEAVGNGLQHATHLFNAMRAMHHREPGVAGGIFLSDELMAEIIFDGIHVSKEMVKLAYRMLGSDRMILITDSMRGKGLQQGTYDLGGQKVHLQEGEARLADGTLAGSVLRMNEAVRNLHTLGVSGLIDIMKMSSLNAARSLGIHHRKGSIAAGKDADLVVMTEDFQVKQTYCKGMLKS